MNPQFSGADDQPEMSRVILTWRILDEDLVGTYHVPAKNTFGEHTSTHRIGVLLLNPGPAPRAGNSDLSVHIGDRLASRGFPVFRFDLPGLGDSSGSTPTEYYTYWQEVLRGRNDATTLVLANKLKQQFGLSSVIVGGLCAATVPTLRVADSHPGAIAGVILMEPVFSVGQESMNDNLRAGMVAVLSVSAKAKLCRVFSVRDWLVFLTGGNRVAVALRPLRPFLVLIQRSLVGHTLPKDMNVPLFMHWRGSLTHGTHSFVVVAEGQGTDRYVAYAMDSLPAKSPGMITLIRVPQTNHTLTSGHARDIVLDAVEQWMLDRFHCSAT